jgi:hypothetical protein
MRRSGQESLINVSLLDVASHRLLNAVITNRLVTAPCIFNTDPDAV